MKKKYQDPQTPYQRLLNCEYIDNDRKEKLKQIFESNNPFKLKKEIEKKLKNIFKLQGVKSEFWLFFKKPKFRLDPLPPFKKPKFRLDPLP